MSNKKKEEVDTSQEAVMSRMRMTGGGAPGGSVFGTDEPKKEEPFSEPKPNPEDERNAPKKK